MAAATLEQPPRASLADRARRTWDVLISLTVADVKMRYGRGPVRRIKWLLDPVAAVGVYLALIALVIDAEGEAAGLSVACAVVPFQLVMSTVINALRSVELRRSVVANMNFRRILIPISCAMTELVGFGATIMLIPLMMAIYGVAPEPAVLLLPIVVAVTFLLSVAFAYPAALIGVWMPEITPFAVSAVRTLFFLAPGVVALDEVYGHTREVLVFNPVTGIFEAFRSTMLEGHAFAAWEILVPLAWAIVLLAIFVPVYRREQRHFAKLL